MTISSSCLISAWNSKVWGVAVDMIVLNREERAYSDPRRNQRRSGVRHPLHVRSGHRRDCGALEGPIVVLQLPVPQALPVFEAGRVVLHDVQIALRDALCRQASEAPRDQGAPDTLPALASDDGEMA